MTLPDTPLLHVPVPPGTPHWRVFPNSDPDTGTVTFTARPSRYAWAAGQDLLAALGKRDDVAGAGRNHDEDLRLIVAWLRAHRATHVITRHADFLEREVLDSLTLLASTANVTLALVHDAGTGQHVVDHVRQHDGDTADPDTLARTLTAAQPPTPPRPTTLSGSLPTVAFPLFRAACRDLLDPDRHALADDLYIRAYRTWRAAAPTTTEQAHTTLTAMYGACTTPAEVTVITKAAQASALALGQHLKVDLPTLLRAAADGWHRRLDDGEIRSLRAYRQPWRAAAVALYDANLSTRDMANLTIADVAADGPVTGAPDLHPAAHPYLRAQRTWRLLTDATPADPLLEVNLRALHNGINRAAGDLLLPPPGNLTYNEARREDRWRHRLGIVLLPATGPIQALKQFDREDNEKETT